jgi:flagellar basal body-associated protein FliL
VKSIKQLIRSTSLFLAGAVGNHYVSKVLDAKENRAQENLEQKTQEFQEFSTNTLTELKNQVKQINSAVEDPKIANELKSECLAKVEEVRDLLLNTIKSGTKLKEHLNNNSSIDVLKEIQIDFTKKLYNASDEVKKLQEFIDNYQPKFNFDLTNLYSYLETLQLNELSALFHILVLLVLLISAIDILVVFFGNEIIIYLELEKKYSRLAKFIQLRRKFQRYYILFNLFLMILVCLLAIIVNIIVLY